MVERNEGKWVGKSSKAAVSSADAATVDGLNSKNLSSIKLSEQHKD